MEKVPLHHHRNLSKCIPGNNSDLYSDVMGQTLIWRYVLASGNKKKHNVTCKCRYIGIAKYDDIKAIFV